MLRLSKIARLTERELTEEGGLGPGVPKRTSTPLPTVKKPETWEFSAHPHHAIRAGKHIDLRLGNPKTGIAHSFVLPRREELPGPGQSALVVPTFDHTIDYMDYTGPISSTYGKGEVKKGRREKTEVYHADSTDEPGTKARFNLYEGAHPEEFSIRKDRSGKWFIHNKTQTRERRKDIPADKPKYKEIEVDQIDPGDDRQAMMPKLDGSHAVIDLRAGRAPRVFSFREAKKTGTGLIEHTHKMPEMLTKKVPPSLDRTILRGEVLGLKGDRPIPAQKIGGLLNSKVWKSRADQERTGVRLKMFPFDVVMHKGKSMEDVPFSEKLKVLREVEKSLAGLDVPPLATNAEEKISLMNTMKAGKHPLTEEGFVLVDKDHASTPIKAKFSKDYDVFVRGVNAAKKKGGGFHDRAGNVSYSWTPDGPVAGTLGGFTHGEARDMLKNPDRYVGRVAKAKAMKVFTDKEGNPTAMFQPRFQEWHLDKGDIEKSAADDYIYLYHGTAEEHLPSIFKEGLLPKRAKTWNMGYTDESFSKKIRRSGWQRASVHLTNDPTFAAAFGAHDNKGKPRGDRPPTILQVKILRSELDAGKISEKQSEASDVLGKGKALYGRAFLHEGKIPPDRLKILTQWPGWERALELNRKNTKQQQFKEKTSTSVNYAAFVDELGKISKEASAPTWAKIVGGAMGAMAGLGAVAMTQEGVRKHLMHEIKSIGRGGGRVGERTASIPVGAIANARKVADHIAKAGIDPAKVRIGIAGTGGTGKSTLAKALANELGFKDAFTRRGAKVLSGGSIPKHLNTQKSLAPGVYEQTHLLNRVDPDKFDVIIRMHKEPKVIREQIMARRRGAAQWDMVNYPKLQRVTKEGLRKTDGKVIKAADGIEMKIKPEGGFNADKHLNASLKKRGIDPTGLNREAKLYGAATGEKPLFKDKPVLIDGTPIDILRKGNLGLGLAGLIGGGAAGTFIAARLR